MPTYDANGNLTAMGSSTYSYDARSLLVAAEGPPEANPGPMTNILNITRDTRRRITRLQHNAQTTYRIYDNWNLIAEYAPSGTLLKEHIHGTRIDEILLTLPASGTGTYHHHDALGNVVALTNAASYAVLETYTYDAFGKRTVYNATGQQIPDTAYANTHGYTGREHLPLSGLIDYRNRSYSTTLGRFLQTDPIRFRAGDINLYRYVANNPVNYYDPYGLSALAGALPWAGGAAVADGPIPIGDAIAAGILAGAAIWDLSNWLMNQSSSDENTAVDGEGKACPESELTPTGESKTEESTRKGNKGGTSVQEGYKDSQGRDVTKHTVYDPNGKPIHGPHYRPGGFK